MMYNLILDIFSKSIIFQCPTPYGLLGTLPFLAVELDGSSLSPLFSFVLFNTSATPTISLCTAAQMSSLSLVASKGGTTTGPGSWVGSSCKISGSFRRIKKSTSFEFFSDEDFCCGFNASLKLANICLSRQ